MRVEADIDEFIELVSSVIEAYTAAFFLADNRKQVLRLWRFHSLSENVIADATIPFGIGPIGRVAESLKPFDLSKFFERDSGLLKLYSKNEGIKSFFAVPVIVNSELSGVLCIDSKKAFVFANKDQKLLTLFAKQLGNLVNNIKVQKFVDTETSDVAFLHNFCSKIASMDDVKSISQLALNSVAHLVKCDSCFLSLKRGDSGREAKQYSTVAAHSHKNMKSMTFSDQDGLAGCIVRGRESILLSNRKRDLGSYVFTPSESVGRVTSFLGVPLLTKDDVAGLICLIDSEENFFNQRDLRVTSIVADNASLAISNIKAQKRSLQLSTSIDGLTCLYNFSGFQERLAAAFQEASQRRRPLSLVIFDLDNFREINNVAGYETGNQILKRIARYLQDLGKEYDAIVARYDSDEFALILPNTVKSRASLIAEMIFEEIESPMFAAPNHGICVSIRAGVSSFPQDSRSCNDLVNIALRAMSKSGTRNNDRAKPNDARNIEIRT